MPVSRNRSILIFCAVQRRIGSRGAFQGFGRRTADPVKVKVYG
jgi:hypothetical protein